MGQIKGRREAARRYFLHAEGNGTDFNIDNGGFKTILGWSTISDTTGRFDVATGLYTVPVSGIYRCDFGVRVDTTKAFGVGVHSGNNDITSGFTWSLSGGTGIRRTVRHGHTARYTAGQTLRVYGYCDDAPPLALNGKYLGIYLVAAD